MGVLPGGDRAVENAGDAILPACPRRSALCQIRRGQKYQRGGLPDFLFHSRRSKAHYKKVYEKGC